MPATKRAPKQKKAEQPAGKTAATTAAVAVAAAAPAAKAPRSRGPGRPSGVAGRLLDRQTVLSIAFSLTKTTSVSDLSIVKVAKELGVTPALIHYYLAGGGRDALTSGVMNAFYREVIETWPPEVDDWRDNFQVAAEAVYRAYLRYPGIAVYTASHNRYQLVQDVAEGETDYGLQLLEKFTGVVRKLGLSRLQTGSLAHLSMSFIQSCALNTVKRRWPGEHADFLRVKLSQLNRDEFPNCHFAQEGLMSLNATEAFRQGLRILLDGFERERERMAPPPAPAPVHARRKAAAG